MENIDDDCKLNDIIFVKVVSLGMITYLLQHLFSKVGDEKEVAKLGMDDSPNLVYYENGIPNLYDGR
jgi:hypothetical protein